MCLVIGDGKYEPTDVLAQRTKCTESLQSAVAHEESTASGSGLPETHEGSALEANILEGCMRRARIVAKWRGWVGLLTTECEFSVGESFKLNHSSGTRTLSECIDRILGAVGPSQPDKRTRDALARHPMNLCFELEQLAQGLLQGRVKCECNRIRRGMN